MSYRFTLAALTAVVTLTGCAKHQTASDQPDNYFKGPSQINVSHVMTRADDGSDIFLTIDGNDAGPLIAGQNTEVRVPAGKHQVGGYAATMLGLGRVTIPALEVTTAAGESTQVAYSVTKDKPVFAKEGVTKLPAPAPAAEPAKPEATPDQNAAITTQPAATSADTSQSATATTTPAAATSTDASQSVTATTTPAATTSTDASQSATTTPAATTSTDASQSAASTTTPAATTSTDASQSATSTTAPATSTDTSQSAASTTAQPATTSTDASQSSGG